MRESGEIDDCFEVTARAEFLPVARPFLAAVAAILPRRVCAAARHRGQDCPRHRLLWKPM